MVRQNQTRLRSIEKLEARQLMTADLNGDGLVEFGDFLVLAEAFGDTAPPFGNGGADIDGDGLVGFRDFLILSASFGASVVDLHRVEFMEPTNPEAFEAVVTSTEQWNDLIQRAHPGSDREAPPVSFDESLLIFKSFGETDLGIWTEVEWLTARENHFQVAYRYVFGGAAPPPGSHVPWMLISVPRVADPTVRFVELEPVPLP